jgi:hypothetical protein
VEDVLDVGIQEERPQKAKTWYLDVTIPFPVYFETKSPRIFYDNRMLLLSIGIQYTFVY